MNVPTLAAPRGRVARCRALFALCGAVCAGVLACASESLSPGSELRGRYVLEAIDGDALPAIVDQTRAGVLRVLSGSVELEPDATVRDIVEYRHDDAPTYTTTAVVPYSLSGNRLIIRRTGRTVADVYADTAWVNAEAMVIARRFDAHVGGETFRVSVYRRHGR